LPANGSRRSCSLSPEDKKHADCTRWPRLPPLPPVFSGLCAETIFDQHCAIGAAYSMPSRRSALKARLAIVAGGTAHSGDGCRDLAAQLLAAKNLQLRICGKCAEILPTFQRVFFNREYAGSNPPRSARHSGAQLRFLKNAKKGRKQGFSRIRYRLQAPNSLFLGRQLPKVSGYVRQYSPFAKTTAGDRVRSELRRPSCSAFDPFSSHLFVKSGVSKQVLHDEGGSRFSVLISFLTKGFE
jgi:hypothetical protein